jgi:hypothetical protein
MELKVMLAHVILNYDIAFPSGISERPKNIYFDNMCVPDPSANLVFRRREAVDV